MLFTHNSFLDYQNLYMQIYCQAKPRFWWIRLLPRSARKSGNRVPFFIAEIALHPPLHCYTTTLPIRVTPVLVA